MQKLGWYIRRLRGMSAGEVAWRLRAALRDAADRVRFPSLARGLENAPPRHFGGFCPGFSVTELAPGCWRTPADATGAADWNEALAAEAEEIAAGRLTFFSLRSKDVGRPVQWNRDHESGVRPPDTFAAALDYRDCRVAGDAKVVWEPNRHHQLVVLGRAYRATGETRFANAVVEQIGSWLDQCRFGRGMNWRSPLELAVRLINWVWSVDLIRPAGVIDDAFFGRLFEAVRLHVWDVSRKYSRGSSANNHTIGEAAGVYVAARYFTELPGPARLAAEARQILCEEIVRQTFADGGSREQALGYQFFVMQFFLLAGLAGRRTGDDFPPAYWARLEKMFEFAAAMIEGGDEAPLFGDYDDGYVLSLCERSAAMRGWLAAAALVFDRTDFARAAGDDSETCAWLLGGDAKIRFEALRQSPATPLTSRAFAESGYYLLQNGGPSPESRVSVLFDCGELGYGPLAAHGHADALSFILRAFGEDILVDPGTYDYFTYPDWRTYLRSTSAHNTIEVDGQDQSVMTGPFMWGQRAKARNTDWQPGDTGGTVAGEHDGYARLSDPVTHRRRLTLDGPELTVEDELIASGRHTMCANFHISEHCRVQLVDENRFEIAARGGTVTIFADPRLKCAISRGEADSKPGWVSRAYHQKASAATLKGRIESEGLVRLVTRFVISPKPVIGTPEASETGVLSVIGR